MCGAREFPPSPNICDSHNCEGKCLLDRITSRSCNFSCQLKRSSQERNVRMTHSLGLYFLSFLKSSQIQMLKLHVMYYAANKSGFRANGNLQHSGAPDGASDGAPDAVALPEI